MARRRRARSVEIVFETHSTTTDNERWVASGWLDGQLSPLGHRQAKELGERRVRGGDRRGVLLGPRARDRDGAHRLRRAGAADLPRLAPARVQLRDAQRHRRGEARGRAHQARDRPVLGRGELHRRGRAGAELPAGPCRLATRNDACASSAIRRRSGRSTTSSRARRSTSSSRARSAGSRAGSTRSPSTADRVACPGTYALVVASLPIGFAGAEAPAQWPQPRSAPRRDRLSAAGRVTAGRRRDAGAPACEGRPEDARGHSLAATPAV